MANSLERIRGKYKGECCWAWIGLRDRGRQILYYLNLLSFIPPHRPQYRVLGRAPTPLSTAAAKYSTNRPHFESPHSSHNCESAAEAPAYSPESSLQWYCAQSAQDFAPTPDTAPDAKPQQNGDASIFPKQKICPIDTGNCVTFFRSYSTTSISRSLCR